MNHSAAITEEGKVLQWGLIGNREEMKDKALLMNPTEIRFPERDTYIVDIKLGEFLTIALSNTRGEVWTWGANDVG